MKLSLHQIDQGIEALLTNAKDLIEEATILYTNARIPRAFALAHLAREELSKVAILQATGTRILANHEIDWKELTKRFRDHKSKLKLEIVEQILFINSETEDKFDYSATENIAETRNNEKNNSLYVGFEKDTFILPSAKISPDKALRTINLAELRFKEIFKIHYTLGKYADREIGSMSHLNDLQKLPPEVLSTIIKDIEETIKEINIGLAQKKL